MTRSQVLAALLLAFALATTACADDGPKRAIGASCVSDGQCDSGICAGNTCLDPAADSDGDGLINRIEAALNMDPLSTDSDGDGKPDFEEVEGTPASAPDTDGDGKVDAAESATADSDADCIADERDPFDGKVESDLAVIADVMCCCAGRCSDLGLNVTALCDRQPVSDGGTGTQGAPDGGSNGDAGSGSDSGAPAQEAGALTAAAPQQFVAVLTCTGDTATNGTDAGGASDGSSDPVPFGNTGAIDALYPCDGSAVESPFGACAGAQSGTAVAGEDRFDIGGDLNASGQLDLSISGGTLPTPIAVTGAVGSDGSVTIDADGLAFSGSYDLDACTGSGSWSSGDVSGTWTLAAGASLTP